MIISGFLFLDENDTTGESNLFSCGAGKRLALSVEKLDSNTTVDLTVKGKVDCESTESFDLAITGAGDLQTASSIGDEGIYFVRLDGIQQVMVKNDGTAGEVKVFGTLSD